MIDYDNNKKNALPVQESKIRCHETGYTIPVDIRPMVYMVGRERALARTWI
jgi:hypothetical protein